MKWEGVLLLNNLFAYVYNTTTAQSVDSHEHALANEES